MKTKFLVFFSTQAGRQLAGACPATSCLPPRKGISPKPPWRTFPAFPQSPPFSFSLLFFFPARATRRTSAPSRFDAAPAPPRQIEAHQGLGRRPLHLPRESQVPGRPRDAAIGAAPRVFSNSGGWTPARDSPPPARLRPRRRLHRIRGEPLVPLGLLPLPPAPCAALPPCSVDRRHG